MKNTLHILILICLLIFSTEPVQATDVPDMKEGLWEVTMKPVKSKEQTGFGAGFMSQMKDYTDTQCLTKTSFIPTSGESPEGQSCDTIKQTVSRNSVSWIVECDSQMGKSTSNGKITYQKNSFTGKIDVKNFMMPMSMEITGKYIGKCR